MQKWKEHVSISERARGGHKQKNRATAADKSSVLTYEVSCSVHACIIKKLIKCKTSSMHNFIDAC